VSQILGWSSSRDEPGEHFPESFLLVDGTEGFHEVHTVNLPNYSVSAASKSRIHNKSMTNSQ